MRDTFYEYTPEHLKHSVTTPIVGYKVGEIGYWPIETLATPEDLNDPGVTPEIIESAQCGSMAGWDVPGAKAALDFSKQNEG